MFGIDRLNTLFKNRLLRQFMLSAAVIVTCAAEAAEEAPRARHGSIAVSYQYQTADSLQSTVGEIDIGPVDTHSLNLEIVYSLTNRWTLVAGLPYVLRRYQGPLQHDPLLLDPPRPDIENVDQGDWNAAFQDFYLGASYRAIEGPTFAVEPHLFLSVPSHDYPFFGNAAVGQGQKRIEIGSSFTLAPGLSDAYYGLDVSYAFVEQVLNTNVNHWRINAEIGYFFAPRLTGRVFALVKEGNGLDFPDDFPPPRTDERWYQHDRIVKHNYVIAGVGLDWLLSDRYEISASLMRMTHAEVIHIMDYAIDLTLSRSF